MAQKLTFKGGDFYIKNNKYYFIKNVSTGFSEDNNDSAVNKIKLLFKRIPFFFNIIYYVFGASFVGRDARYAIRDIGSDKSILNLGSGVKEIREDVINVDFFPFDNVDIVADIADLPFADQSIDAVICEFVLEHVPNSAKVVEETKRILRPGGVVYISVPFVASFHSSPNDYYRWSKQGLKYLLKDFNEIDSGVRCGPTSALIYVLSEWLGTVFGFGITNLQQVIFIMLMILLSPIKLIDWFISKIPSSENIAYGFYFIGHKI